MKKRANQILLAVTVVTAALYALLLLSSPLFGLIPLWPEPTIAYSALSMGLAFGFHAAPCFCLQLLVCRAAKRTVLRLIPVFLLLGFAMLCVVLFFTVGGLDALLWAILFLLCIAPAVGFALAWAVYGIDRARGRSN